MRNRFVLLALTFSLWAWGGALAQQGPRIVNVPGTIQPELGCPGPWQPDCQATVLEYDAVSDIWLRTFALPAGSYEYKVALNGNWGENYGGFADRDGPNIRLGMPQDRETITFFYDNKTKWVMDNVRFRFLYVVGDFQTALGCPANNDLSCYRGWVQDVDGDGIYSFTSSAIPAGDYRARLAEFDQDATLGADGTAQGADVTFNVPQDGKAVTFLYDSKANVMIATTGGAVSGGNLLAQKAYWVLEDTLLWNVERPAGATVKLLSSADASIRVSLFGMEGTYESFDLTPIEAVPGSVQAKFPHLADHSAYTIAPADLARVPELLRAQTFIALYDADGGLLDLTGLQIPGALDDLYAPALDEPLGVVFDEAGVPSVRVWAPTARNVALLLYPSADPGAKPETLPMTRDNATGIWTIRGQADWLGKFYKFSVDVYVPSELAYVVNEVTDPYSVSLSINSQRSQIVDLRDPALQPEGWASLVKPPLDAPEDIVIYELHIRDFSAFDESVPAELRGTYLAFTLPDSHGVKHLRALSEAGLTHLHLLPSFDIATINENRARWFEPDYALLASFPPDSDQQQALIEPNRDRDGFNWGYDPFHFNTPEGSYSTQPNGSGRVVEYRRMIQALNELGLRVVVDVVYNHTNASGQANRSVFDRIVPGYYHRLNAEGRVERSTCCDNTATEHDMMRKFMIDSVLLYATQYKVDGFRFDLMGHHMLADMMAVRAALDSLTLEEHGVDGKSIYIYGEGWNFGEVANNARGVNATQLNIAGTGIGVFNDRLRDAVRGGNPFGDREKQGLANGLFTQPNGLAAENEDLARLLRFGDQTRVGLAGNLADIVFISGAGQEVSGAQVDYNGSPTGYTADPQENILYVDKHDNETLFDNNIYKAPADTPMSVRIRMQALANAFVMYGQGVPFFQAGTDLLRSKSLDRNSYNSGDWFNRLDWTYQTNNFGVGLPPAADNRNEWDRMRPFLANPANVPASEDIQLSAAIFRDMLRVRASTPLFRLRTGDDVRQRVSFPIVDGQPNVIVYAVSDLVGLDLDPNYDGVLVVFNTASQSVSVTLPDFAETAYELHPVLAGGADPDMRAASASNGTFSVPPYSAAVFVAPQK